MLVLSRKKKESIVIGKNIEITIVDIKEGSVKIAISAPKSIPVYRKEIYLEIQKQNLQSLEFHQEAIIDKVSEDIKKKTTSLTTPS